MAKTKKPLPDKTHFRNTPDLVENCKKFLEAYKLSLEILLPIHTPLIQNIVCSLKSQMKFEWIVWQYAESLEYLFVTDVIFYNMQIYIKGFEICTVYSPLDELFKPVAIPLDYLVDFAHNVVNNDDDWPMFYNCPERTTKEYVAMSADTEDEDLTVKDIDNYANEVSRLLQVIYKR